MKKINMSKVNETNGAPKAAVQVPVQAAEAFVEEKPAEASPPMPAHIGAVTPPTEPEPELPTTFEGFVELSKLVAKRQGPSEKSALWASLAQAMATKQLAEKLEDLLEFLGARDIEDDLEDGPRFADQISNGIVNAAMIANEELLPPGAVDLFKLQAQNKFEEFAAQVKTED